MKKTRDPLPQKACVICGKMFTPKSIRNVCCSVECSVINNRGGIKVHESKKCIVCGAEFVPRNGCQICCSKECADERNAAMAKRYTKKYMADLGKTAKEQNELLEKQNSPFRVCGRCGKKFTFERGKSSQNRCPKCYEKDKIQKQRILEQERILGEPKPTHLCADCHKVRTFNHRCPKCLALWRAKHGVPQDLSGESEEYNADL